MSTFAPGRASARAFRTALVAAVAAIALALAFATLAASTAQAKPSPDPPQPKTLMARAYNVMQMNYLDFTRFRDNHPGEYKWFVWKADGCSGPQWIRPTYRKLFHRPCLQHDFGYRNYGSVKKLKPNEKVRAWVDWRFHQEMKRLCRRNWGRFNPQRGTCLGQAKAVWAGVSKTQEGRDAFYKG